MSSKLHKEITDRIVAQLRAGVVPWKRPWSGQASGSFPRNAITGRGYSGVNVLLLWSEQINCGYERPLWLTYKQAAAAGGQVRKGEKSVQVVFLSSIVRKDDTTGEDRHIGFLKTFNVFNVAQIDNLDIKYAEPRVRNPHTRDELAEEFFAHTGADIRHGGSRAYYTTRGDYIQMPEFETFDGADSYYATLAHEAIHWTGHESRMNRQFGKRFGDQAYAAEELVAELGSAFICSEFGFDNSSQDAAYIASWIKFLSDHDGAIITAAAAASKAVESLRERVLVDPELEMAA